MYRKLMYAFVLVLGIVPMRLAATEAQTLCSNLIASLMPVPGNLDSGYASQRVEVRQCPVSIARKSGTIQLVGWAEGATSPGLIYETEDSGFYQLVMIPGAYVFELMGGNAQPVIAIVFKDGIPQVALAVSTTYNPVITSDGSRIVVEVVDSKDGVKRRFEVQKTGKPRRY